MSYKLRIAVIMAFILAIFVLQGQSLYRKYQLSKLDSEFTTVSKSKIPMGVSYLVYTPDTLINDMIEYCKIYKPSRLGIKVKFINRFIDDSGWISLEDLKLIGSSTIAEISIDRNDKLEITR